MMTSHNSAVFNHSCLKVPRNPSNRRPIAIYEQQLFDEIESKMRDFNIESKRSTTKQKSIDDYCDANCFRTFIEFFDSIPNYEDVNHLSNREFYRKLDQLKEKQRNYFLDYSNCGTKYAERNVVEDDDWSRSNRNDRTTNKRSSSRPKSNLKSFCTTPTLNSNAHYRKHDEESLLSSSETANKPPSRRSVRIESPSDRFLPIESDEYARRSKSRMNVSSSVASKDQWEELPVKCNDEESAPRITRSAPCSPNKSKQTVGWKDSITIPKPFQMTVRDEENKIIDEILVRNVKPKEKKHETFKAHPVPIESKIPLFDKIMAEQERRREIVKRKSKANLVSQMRPFSFTRREEELQNLTRHMSRSTPNLCINNYTNDRLSRSDLFKAKPVPKNLFSNYVYRKMHEDEFYRALQKKIRAEEMLRAASLPPSMERRERFKIKSAICASLSNDEQICKRVRRKDSDSERTKAYRKGKKKRIKSSSSTSTSRNVESMRSSSTGFDCATRSNLAAVLRAQNTRKRLALEMYKKLEDAKVRDELRWKEKVMRKRPVWDVLAYSHEEDLAMRLQMRRDEERLRNAEHKERMHSMLGRVNRQPTLFERQSMMRMNANNKKTINKEIDNYSSDKYSFISDCSEKRYLIDVKDEAVQADDSLIEKYVYDDREKDND